ncbi:hypothetical protein Tco_0169942 [Tanacetum coccineum]
MVRAHKGVNVALTHFDEEFIQKNPKELSYAQKKVKEDVGLGSGLEAVEKKPEKDGTNSLREQGKDVWQPTSETDLQDIQDTPNCCNLKPHMDVTREDRAHSKPRYCSYVPDLRCDQVQHLVVVMKQIPLCPVGRRISLIQISRKDPHSFWWNMMSGQL